MSTRGDYTIIPGRGEPGDDHYFSAYNHRDMYPEGNLAGLLEEAAYITDQNIWERIAKKWATKEWLDRIEKTRPEANSQVAALVEAADAGTDYKASVFWPGCLAPNRVLGETPSWEGVANMPVAQKHLVFGSDAEFSIVVDLPNTEIVVFDNAKGPAPAAVIPLEPDALRAAAAEFRLMNGAADWEKMRPRRRPKRSWEFTRHPERVNANYTRTRLEVNVPDGQWKRPEGFPPMKGAPPNSGGLATTTALCPEHPGHRHQVLADGASLVRCAEPVEPITIEPASPSSAAASAARCKHVGPVSKKQCIRPPHKGRDHRYQ